ncbi:MAG: glycosyltransferase family 4 protein [Bacteroidetes bacterium]|nr:glycosyltransferase family 4 protein [Bacteroidota bacterium]
MSLLYLIRGLDRSRYHPIVLCIHESEACDLFRREGIETVVDDRLHDFSHTNVLWYPWWQFPKILLRLWQFPLTYRRARAFLRERSFDIVHLNTSTLTAFGMAARAEHCKVVWHVREPLQRGYLGIRRMCIRRIIHRCADLILPICRYDAAQLQPSPTIHVVYNFIDFNQFDATIDGGPMREELGISSDAHIVIMLGGVNPIKGTREFVRAAVNVLRVRDDVVFLVVGPVPDDSIRNRINGLRVYRNDVLRIIGDGKKNNIRLLGVRRDIPRLLAASDILCFPSTVPHFARPVIEASAMGLPVIASDLGGPQELVRHQETGLLVPPRSSEALADALFRLLDDTDLRRRMGQQGIAFAREHFDAQRNTQVVLERYDDLFS